jgi:protein-disulfide isomerase
MESQAAKDRLAEDRKLWEDLKLNGTPTLYVNGRQLDGEPDEALEDRVAGELGVSPTAPPAPSGTASSTP